MQSGLGDRIFDRFFQELAGDSAQTRHLAEELRRLYDERSLDRENELVILYQHLAEETA